MAHDRVFGICENKCLVPIANITEFKYFFYPCILTSEARTVWECPIPISALRQLGVESDHFFALAQSAMNDVVVSMPYNDEYGVVLGLRSLTDTPFDFAEVNLFIFGTGIENPSPENPQFGILGESIFVGSGQQNYTIANATVEEEE